MDPKDRKAPASSEELDVAQKEVVQLLKNNKYLLRLLTGVVIVSLAIISATGIIAARTSADAREVGNQNNRFLENFSNYMRCLIVNEDDVIIAIGEEAYLNLCDELLFRGTGQKPNVIIVEIPKDFPTTTTTPAPPGG